MKTLKRTALEASSYALIVVCLSGVPLSAQEPAPGDDALFQRGPLRLAPTMTLKNVGLDSNVFNEIDADDPESDFTATLTPAAAVWLNIGHLRVASHHSVDIVYFQSHADQRSVGTSHDIKVEAPLNRLTPWFSAGTLSTRDRPGYEIDVRARRGENSLGAGADWNAGGRTSLAAGVRRNVIAFEPDGQLAGAWLRQMLDRRADAIEVAVRHKVTPLTTAAVLASGGREHFAFSPIRDGDSLRITPGFEFGARIQGAVWVGYRRTDFVSPLMPDFSGLVASADVSYEMFSGTKVNLGATRDLVYSYEIDQPYYVQTGLSGTITQYVVSAWDVQGRMARQRLAYQRLVEGVRADGGLDRVLTVGAGIGYHLSPDVRLGLNLDLHRRRSEGSRRDYERLIVGTSVTYGF